MCHFQLHWGAICGEYFHLIWSKLQSTTFYREELCRDVWLWINYPQHLQWKEFVLYVNLRRRECCTPSACFTEKLCSNQFLMTCCLTLKSRSAQRGNWFHWSTLLLSSTSCKPDCTPATTQPVDIDLKHINLERTLGDNGNLWLW